MSLLRPSNARIQRHLQRLQQSLPAALAKRFVEIDLMTQAASLAFYALLSLAPLLILLLWLTASLYPTAQQELVEQIGVASVQAKLMSAIERELDLAELVATGSEEDAE